MSMQKHEKIKEYKHFYFIENLKEPLIEAHNNSIIVVFYKI